jgi:transposase
MHDCPTGSIQTIAARLWLESLRLPKVDQIILEQAMERWRLLDKQLIRLDIEVKEHAMASPAAQLIMSIPKVGHLTALTIASRIGSIDRFPRPGSLANMFGLTPTINDTGDSTGRRGGITKHGHPSVRFVLGQLVARLTSVDPRMRAIYRKIRKRRGAKTAMVAIMRRIVCTLWHMLKTGEAYRIESVPPDPKRRAAVCRT